ncbi:MAG: hypothetical protein LBV08_10810 [Clostridiales bacterium]|nr:hypothetical protein [Clostridiales bacterium]
MNNLLTGKTLAAEIPSSANGLRSFVSTGAYRIDEMGRSQSPSKFINSKYQDEYKFWFWCYEIGVEFIENGWDILDGDLINPTYKKGINSVKELEHELVKYLEDLSILDVEWRCDNPL